jgi:hypothetical protein
VDARGNEFEFHIYKRGSKRYTAAEQQNGWMKSATFGKSFRLIRGVEATGNPESTLGVK